MNALMNKVQLIGNLGQDPELKETQKGRKYARFSLATNETYTVNGERKTDTQWHDIVAWGKTAEIIAQYLKKGSRVLVNGKLNYSQWEDKTGIKRYSTSIVVSDFLMLDGRKNAETSAATTSAAPQEKAAMPF